jgi:hypothetical protein
MNSLGSIKSKIKLSFISLMVRYNTGNGILPVEIRSTVGLGAKLEWCLEILAYSNEHNLIPQFKFSYPNSGKFEDYFSRFFSLKCIQERPVRFVKISSIIELDLGKDYDTVLNIGLANYLINKYLFVREDVISEVEDYCCQHFANRRVLGVHYRGTDKVLESPMIPYDRVKRNIERYLEIYPETDCVFIATDDISFLENMENTSVGRPLLFRNDSFRSRNGDSIHESAYTNKYEINRDAIVNCLILSRCDALLKTASILSGWSKLFNPQLPTVMLSAPYSEHLWFPERDLVNNNLFEPIP